MKPKVYIPNLPTRFDAATGTRVPSLDLNTAVVYGTMINLTDGPVPTSGIAAALAAVETQISLIEPDDLILCVGDIILTAAAIHYAAAQLDVVRLLRWDKKTHLYEICEVVL